MRGNLILHHPAPVDELELPVVKQPPEQRPAGVSGVAVLMRIDSAGKSKSKTTAPKPQKTRCLNGGQHTARVGRGMGLRNAHAVGAGLSGNARVLISMARRGPIPGKCFHDAEIQKKEKEKKRDQWRLMKRAYLPPPREEDDLDGNELAVRVRRERRQHRVVYPLHSIVRGIVTMAMSTREK